MPSKLRSNSLYINDTQQVSGIYTALNNTHDQIPTSAALVTFLRGKGVQPFPPTSLSITGSWAQSTQTVGDAPDPSGLIFTAAFSDGATSQITEVSVRPVRWTATGEQTATFYYTVGGTTVMATKTCHIVQNDIYLDAFQVDDTATDIDFIF